MSLDARTMQQLTFLAPNKFEWREVPTPHIENSKQAIVRPLAVTRCDLDLYIANGIVKLQDEPFAFEHEIAGEVVEIGDEVISRTISFDDAADFITDPDVKIVFVREEQ